MILMWSGRCAYMHAFIESLPAAADCFMCDTIALYSANVRMSVSSMPAHRSGWLSAGSGRYVSVQSILSCGVLGFCLVVVSFGMVVTLRFSESQDV